MAQDSGRRRWLLACAGLLTGLAGCLGDGDDGGTAGGGGDDDVTNNGGGTDGADAGIDDPSEPTSYAFEVDSISEMGDGTVITSHVEGYVTANGDSYINAVEAVDDTESTMEHYHVDGTSYIETRGTCQSVAGHGVDMSPCAGYESYGEFARSMEDLEPDPTTTIDGEEASVFESDQDDVPASATGDGVAGAEGEWRSTVYVSTETGYLLKSDYQLVYEDERESTSSSRLHSFGDEFSVEPPSGC